MESNKNIFNQNDVEEESTALDSDDYSSAATGGESSCGQTRSGKRFRRSSRSPGEEVILAGAKRRIILREEPCSEAERAMIDQIRAAEEGRKALGVDSGDPRTADALARQAATDVDIICTVATTSSNLKGTFVRALQDAASSIKAVVAALKDRTATDEVRKVQLENARLRSEMAELRQHVAELRRRDRDRGSPLLPLPAGREDLEERMTASVSGTVQRIIDARFAGLEERLLPAKTLRPPLAADRRRIAAEKTPVQAKSRGTKGAHPKLAEGLSRADEEPTATHTADDGERSTVQHKRKKKRAAKTYAAAAATAPAKKKKPQPQPQPQPKTKTARKPRLAAPRSPAVLITLDEYAVSKGVTYCHLMERAAEQVDLKTLGINDGLTIRRAATGARLLELPKGQAPEVAKRLAEELQTAFGSLARVVQPTKLASLRVSGLDDSVTSEAVATAIAKMGKRDAGDVKVGAIAVGPGGLGGTVVRCPIPAAKALAEAGRLLVGWSSARVQILEQRPMRCYKCMGIGHTRPTCPAAVDRRGACFRCGVEGHIASNCNGALRCAVCADAGKPASHIMGGRECRPPKSRVRAVAKSSTAPQSSSHQVTEETAAMSS
ncbi:unnamed protein product [Euphydryas editha]|uniref:CCHC-type domain-containing protein n=1 Tax=Euphydryas editha TaxID=104508 RepID=A0AAU9US06_EUPED|nr:unnamed protein product [Euphydryas editha]